MPRPSLRKRRRSKRSSLARVVLQEESGHLHDLALTVAVHGHVTVTTPTRDEPGMTQGPGQGVGPSMHRLMISGAAVAALLAGCFLWIAAAGTDYRPVPSLPQPCEEGCLAIGAMPMTAGSITHCG